MKAISNAGNENLSRARWSKIRGKLGGLLGFKKRKAPGHQELPRGPLRNHGGTNGALARHTGLQYETDSEEEEEEWAHAGKGEEAEKKGKQKDEKAKMSNDEEIQV